MEYVKLIFNLLFYFSLCTMLEISIPPFSLLGCARELGNCLLRWRWWRSSPQWKNWSTWLSHCSSWLLSILCYALGRDHGGSDVLGYFCTADLPTKFTFCINIKAFAFVFFCTCNLFQQKNQSYRLSKSITFLMQNTGMCSIRRWNNSHTFLESVDVCGWGLWDACVTSIGCWKKVEDFNFVVIFLIHFLTKMFLARRSINKHKEQLLILISWYCLLAKCKMCWWCLFTKD